MAKKPDKALIAAALRARRHASAPYSRFRVGAALRTLDGTIITGANVESASYGLTCCAERIALFKAITEGYREFAAIAIAARWPGGAMPCGACRQLLAEYAPDAEVWVVDSAHPDRPKRFKTSTLLPHAFRMSTREKTD
ncbi:MAG TPA: cytidine deaminase [Roseimicrobium sp.]|nr:cytidine deaminase [Roseimicrobium sp.]